MMGISPLSDPGIIPNPYPVYADLAEREPVHWCEELKGWAVFKHADCTSALKDTRLKAERMDEVLQAKFDRVLPPESIYHQFTKNVMMYTDDQLHHRLRRSTQPAFNRTAYEHYDEVIRRVAADLVATLPARAQEIDVVPAVVAGLPVRSAVHAFGVPEEDLDFILPCVDELMTYWSGPQGQPLALDHLLDRLDALHVYARELVEGKQGVVAAGTVIDRLATAQPDNEDSTLDQTVHQLVLLFIALFAPTTPGSVSSGMLSFASNPEQIERFRTDASCADNAPNEVVRYNASNQFTWRVARESLTIGDVRIAKGECLALFIGAANRDPDVFTRPHEFDLDRPNSGKHLSFGGGAHTCLGRHLASLQIKWFFHALFERFPRIGLAGEPEWNANLEFRSLRSLPLSLG